MYLKGILIRLHPLFQVLGRSLHQLNSNTCLVMFNLALNKFSTLSNRNFKLKYLSIKLNLLPNMANHHFSSNIAMDNHLKCLAI